MRKFPVPGLALAAMVAFGAACDSGSTGPDDAALDAAESEFLAVEADLMLSSLLGDQLAALGDPIQSETGGVLMAAFEPIVTTFRFERTRPCRDGGTVVANGSGTRTVDRDTKTVTTDFSGEKTTTDCVRTRGDLTFTVNGLGTFEGHRMKVAGAWSGLQTHDQEGRLSYVVSDGRSRECTYEIHRVADPEAGTLTVTGHICDHEINKTTEWDGQR